MRSMHTIMQRLMADLPVTPEEEQAFREWLRRDRERFEWVLLVVSVGLCAAIYLWLGYWR